MNLQSGAFGDPTQMQTLILFWTKMELLHYPGAGETKAYLEEELKRQQEQQQMAAQMQRMQQRQMTASGDAWQAQVGGTANLENSIGTAANVTQPLESGRNSSYNGIG